MSSGNSFVKSLTEEEVVDAIARRLVSHPSFGEYLDYPDDARDIIPRGPRILFSMDAYTLSSLRLPWRSLRDVGWAAFTGPISDVVSKGGVPLVSMLALGIPGEWRITDLLELVEGFREASSHYGVRILGGDTNNSSEAWIAISVIGFTSAKIPPRRMGLKPGDVVIATGVYGAMGFISRHGINEAIRHQWIIEATKKPTARVEVAYVIASQYRAITASMDVSDGLGYTLGEMSKLSKCGVLIKQPPRVHREIVELCRDNIDCILDYSLNGGEEYGVVLGVRQDLLNHVVRELEYYEVDYSIIGNAVEAEPGVYFNGKKLNIGRYDQFKGWITQTQQPPL